MVTSVNRLVAVSPYSAQHVEAPDPDIIMRRHATSERTMTPAASSPLHPRSPCLRNKAGSDRPSTTTAKRNGESLDISPQLKGRITRVARCELFI